MSLQNRRYLLPFLFFRRIGRGRHEAQDARRKGGEKSIITLIFRIYLFLLWLYFSPPFPSAARVWRSPPPPPRPPLAYPPPCQSVKKKITPVLQSRSVWFMKSESCRKLLTKVESYGNGCLLCSFMVHLHGRTKTRVFLQTYLRVS